MRTVLTLLLTLTLVINVLATSQAPDKILYNGEMYMLNCNPLEEYFEKKPEKRPKVKWSSSGLWRDYIATFEIRDNQLHLKDINILYKDSTSKEVPNFKLKSVLNEVFPDNEISKIEWFTGLLVIPQGEMIMYSHMGYASSYEEYILLEIENGNFIREKRLNYKDYLEFKEKQFQAFKLTDEYKKIKARLKDKGDSDESIDDFIKRVEIKYTTKILTE